MNICELSNRLAVAGVKHVLVTGRTKLVKRSTVTASEDTLIGLWTGWNIIFDNHSTHTPLPTKTGIKGTVPAKVLYNDDTMTYRAFTYTEDVADWREGFNRIYSGRPEEVEIELADPKRSGDGQ